MATSPQLIEQSTRHQVFLERVKSGEAAKFAAFLKEMDVQLRLRLSAETMTDFSRGRVERLITGVNTDLNAIYARYLGTLQTDLADIADYEAGFEARSIDQVVRGFESVIPSPEQVRAAVLSAPLSVRGVGGGKLLDAFMRDWSANDVERISGVIRRGFYEGQTNADMIRTVRGTRANKYNDGELAITNRGAKAMVRTAVQHTASIARQATWDANSDLVKKVKWVSTLDGRTTQICRSLDGQLFPVDSGPRPPIHVSCRSTTVAELDDEFDFLKAGATRSSVNGYVAQDQTYYQWLKKQPKAFQNSTLGVRRAALLRNGGLSSERFAELNLGKNFEPLTLAEMRRLEPLAFERAGI